MIPSIRFPLGQSGSPFLSSRSARSLDLSGAFSFLASPAYLALFPGSPRVYWTASRDETAFFRSLDAPWYKVRLFFIPVVFCVLFFNVMDVFLTVLFIPDTLPSFHRATLASYWSFLLSQDLIVLLFIVLQVGTLIATRWLMLILSMFINLLCLS